MYSYLVCRINAQTANNRLCESTVLKSLKYKTINKDLYCNTKEVSLELQISYVIPIIKKSLKV